MGQEWKEITIKKRVVTEREQELIVIPPDFYRASPRSLKNGFAPVNLLEKSEGNISTDQVWVSLRSVTWQRRNEASFLLQPRKARRP